MATRVFRVVPCRPLLIRSCRSYVLLMFLTVCPNALFLNLILLMNLTRHTHEVCLIILNSDVPYCINNVTFLFQMAVTKPMALLT